MADRDEQVLSDLVLQEREVVRALHLVADDLQADPEVPCVLPVLAVDRDALAGGLGDQERHVEAGEHPGGEGVAARRHVDDDELVAAVDEVVQAQLHRPHLGVVAGHAQIGVGERPGRHQLDLGVVVQPDGPRTRRVHRVVLADAQQP